MPTYTPSKATLATRSLTAALAQKQGKKRQQAVSQHFERFAPPIRRGTCPVQRSE